MTEQKIFKPSGDVPIDGEPSPPKWPASYLADAPEQGCVEATWYHLAVRCALLHHAKCGGRASGSVADYTEWYSEAGPEFCIAALSAPERHFSEIPF